MLRVLLVTQDDPFYVVIFFRELFKCDFKDKFQLIGVIIQPPLGKKSKKVLIKQMLDFYGLWNFVVHGVKYVFLKVLNTIAVKLFKGKFPGSFSVNHILLKNDVNIFDLKNINSEKSIRFVKSLNIDIIFSIAASQIFREKILELPDKGCFNIHTSKLPKNRGMMPNFWSLFNYDLDPTSAITIHKMNNNLDDGEILIQHEFQLNPNESLDTLIRNTKKESVNVFFKAIDKLSSNEVKLLPNDSLRATYNTFPTKEDVRRFIKKGLKLQ